MAAYGGLVTVAVGKVTGSVSNLTTVITEASFHTNAIDGGVNSILNGGGNLRCYTDATKDIQISIDIPIGGFVTGATPSIQVWVLNPTLQDGDTVYIEADTVATAQPAFGGDFGRNATWVDSYIECHLEENGTDSSGNSDLYELVGSATFVDAKVGKGLSFNGLTHISTPGGIASSGDNVRISVWVNPTDTTADTYITHCKSGATNNLLSIVMGFTDNYFNLWDKNSYPTGNVADTQVLATPGVLQKITYATDGTILKAYKNGVEVLSVLANMSTSITGCRLGANAIGTNRFTGILDEFTYSKRGIDDDFELAEYSNQSSPSTFWEPMATWAEQGGGITITANITSEFGGFSETINIKLPVNIKINPKNIGRVARKNNTIRVARKNNTIRVN